MFIKSIVSFQKSFRLKRFPILERLVACVSFFVFQNKTSLCSFGLFRCNKEIIAWTFRRYMYEVMNID
jgi:hypothetical protein